jgi:ketosteroid isomerase-like protein
MRLLLVGIFLFAVCSFSLGQMEDKDSLKNNAEQELKRLENEWLNSYLRGDKQTFDRIVADDFTRTDESGKFATKAEERALVQAPPASVSASLTNDDMHVRVYGNSAIVTGLIVSRVQGSLSFQSRFTDTFIKSGASWQVVARHYSRVPTERTSIHVDSKIYDDYVGQYEIASNVLLDITKEGEKLMSQTTGQAKMELLPESEIEFFIKGFTAQFVFVRDGTGKVTKLIINQEGQRVTVNRVK